MLTEVLGKTSVEDFVSKDGWSRQLLMGEILVTNTKVQ
jgi:hypothetical protein